MGVSEPVPQMSCLLDCRLRSWEGLANLQNVVCLQQLSQLSLEVNMPANQLARLSSLQALSELKLR